MGLRHVISGASLAAAVIAGSIGVVPGIPAQAAIQPFGDAPHSHVTVPGSNGGPQPYGGGPISQRATASGADLSAFASATEYCSGGCPQLGVAVPDNGGPISH
jgi:hypothetical protein